ncbi:AAA15 family ATPase/GTPase [Malaciobacter marinus]|jgi:AAA15 family ATPase/GTPase|uniref:AAA15 family ATPase/GTPase n=1 Tax=Malaciobacter marinus TaxID=505249 RepID=A0AB36ZZT5_9BACT|nr:ATP-binding protein [Malaciobacter marinus]PPK61941.1 AAA15 family ATPase/GTPase [Malaciobacter marinus]SKB25745.1 ATPase/GTPase, AAA15 family [Malaciobacter marinus]
MLVEFTVNNFKSIKDTVKFSMLTSSKDEGNSFEKRKYNLLKSAILYGANASGKSNFLRAMAFMSRFVLNKYKIIQSTDKLPHEPFRLSTETEDSSSSFETVFFIKDIKYRYGFEIDNKLVYSEWLYADEKGKEAKLFYRDLEEKEYVNPNKFVEGYSFFNKKDEKINVSTNQLFIWKCDQENGEISKAILNWFNRFNMIDGMNHNGYINFTMKKMENEDFKEKIINLVKTADIGIDDIQVEEEDVPLEVIEKLQLPEFIKDEMVKEGGFKSITLNTLHQKFDNNGKVIDNVIFELEKEESKGTRKFFAMSAPILDTLENGKILIIDELDASLHPILTQHLIKLFHDENINKNNAQLIFATHDTNLLKKTIFRRDQIWLSEKDKFGSTDLYSLAQFKNVRKNEDFEKQYIHGKYGAIPYLGKFEF